MNHPQRNVILSCAGSNGFSTSVSRSDCLDSWVGCDPQICLIAKGFFGLRADAVRFLGPSGRVRMHVQGKLCKAN